MKPIVLMQPYVTDAMRIAAAETLKLRFIGQGPRVDCFEKQFEKFIGAPSVAVSSGTAALHLAYVLAGIRPGDEVVAPLFTCTATNTPLLQCGARIKFTDVAPDSLNVGIGQINAAVTDKTKAIVVVHYGGAVIKHLPGIVALCRHRGITLIEDCAQAIGGASSQGHGLAGSFGDFAAFSFQAVKHVTTVDGGMLVINPSARGDNFVEKAKRLRWFGIDRAAKLENRWANDITELGYKYQMSDVSASMGIESLAALSEQLDYRRVMMGVYSAALAGVPGISTLDYHPSGAVWICTVAAERRENLIRKLAENQIEAGQVHYRNDRYSIFRASAKPYGFPNMDAIDAKYLVLPLHMGMDSEDVNRVCTVIQGGW